VAKKQKFPYLVGSKWTAQAPTFGWRHFQVVNRKNQGSLVFAEVTAACDPTVRFWINAKSLRQRGLWQAGWQSLQEQANNEFIDDGPTVAPCPLGLGATTDSPAPNPPTQG
jgi:tryptophan-rich hypothetical protein